MGGTYIIHVDMRKIIQYFGNRTLKEETTLGT